MKKKNAEKQAEDLQAEKFDLGGDFGNIVILFYDLGGRKNGRYGKNGTKTGIR
ncbi:MAG: hypothetical protein HFH15_15910 [Ruminococcus sp.]|nr:hypothetical protein [Ruminococcus sp.]